MYICDRFIIPTLSSAESHQVETEELSLDVPTRQFIRKELSFRFMETSDGDSAYNIAREVQQGCLRAGKPLLNPLAAIVERWAERVAELQAYKEKHGDCNLPEDGSELGNWVAHLKFMEKRRLTKYPVLCWQLDKLGFNWNEGTVNLGNLFFTRCEELVAYKEEQGDCLVPKILPGKTRH